MRVHGRTLHASTLDEQRLLQGLGVESLHIPRRENPFRVARRIEQIVRRQREEVIFLRQLIIPRGPHREPQPSPGLDLPDQENDALRP